MKEITVLAFGVIADILGKNNFVVNNVGSTDELKIILESDFPKLKTTTYTVAVNKRLIATSMQLDDRATVALLPPFSGG